MPRRREVAASCFWAHLQQACAASSSHCVLLPPGQSDIMPKQQQQPVAWMASVRQLVVYGLGSMEGSATSRYQLALVLLLMQQLLPQLAAPPILFDP